MTETESETESGQKLSTFCFTWWTCMGWVRYWTLTQDPVSEKEVQNDLQEPGHWIKLSVLQLVDYTTYHLTAANVCSPLDCSDACNTDKFSLMQLRKTYIPKTAEELCQSS